MATMRDTGPELRRADGGPIRVLVVDDEASLSELLSMALRSQVGTSGGPLLNLKGEMVGLTTALAATAGYEQSAGYALPVDETFRRVVEALKLGREVEYGFLGIAPVNLRPEAVLSGLEGTLIERVVPQGNAPSEATPQRIEASLARCG